jgi:hypothetical protein
MMQIRRLLPVGEPRRLLDGLRYTNDAQAVPVKFKEEEGAPSYFPALRPSSATTACYTCMVLKCARS